MLVNVLVSPGLGERQALRSGYLHYLHEHHMHRRNADALLKGELRGFVECFR